jgi:primosomal protein N'
MLFERCRRDDAPWWFTSVAPSPTLLALGRVHPWGELTHGWPRIDVVDRREADPHDGVLTRHTLEAAHRALEGTEPVAVVVILQRLGHGRLLACRRCGELARCAQCHQAEVEVDDELACADQHERLARDVALQLSVRVDEVTAASAAEITSRVVVGTEAVFSRVRRCSLVVFIDFDQYLLAPRESARRHALGAVAKAGRLVGSRREGRGSVVVQTRRHDEVIDALVNGDVEAVVRDDAATAELLGLPPYGARAVVSGEVAEEFVSQIDGSVVRVRRVDDTWVLSTAEVDVLTNELRAVTRPPGRLRVEVY